MSIADELREWMFDHTVSCSDNRIALVAIADRIDAEHESKVSYWQGASYKDGYDEGFASADDWLAQHEDAMAEHGWIRLPLDADGVPIRIGDKMGFIGSDGNVSDLFVVKGFESPDMWLVHYEEGHRIMTNPMHTHHYHEPTVEDVLEQFLTAYDDADEGQLGITTHDVIAEYAAKLKLRGDGE